MNEHNEQPITRQLVPEEQRVSVAANHFGMWFPMVVETSVYNIAERLTGGQYNGGYWEFYELSNSGFYFAPQGCEKFSVTADNDWQGDMTADALGITACLYTYSLLSYADNVEFGKLCAEHYYWLRDFAIQHREFAAILAATD